MDFLKKFNFIQVLCLFFIILGILLRIDYFMANRSLRGDEAAYFDCLVSRTPQEVLLNKNYNFYSPASPIAFSLMERSVMDHAGNSEYALRFIPLIFSLSGVLFFYFLVSQYPLSWGRPLAMGLFAVSDRLIFFSADMRPYSLEVFFAIFILWMFNLVEKNGFHSKHMIYFIFTAIISVWFSYTVVFILGGIAVTSLGGALFEKQWGTFRQLLMMHCCWVISFLIVYMHTIHPIIQTGVTYSMWEGYFIKGPQDVFGILHWALKTFWDFFRDPLGIISPVIGILLFFWGIRRLFYINRKQCFLILSPFILTLAAALFKEYPFIGRVVLFLVPCFFIFIALGVEAILVHGKGVLRSWGLILAFAVLFIYPLMKSLDYFVHGWDNEEARQAVYYLKNNMLPQDIVLMNTSARFSFGYYMGYFHIDMKGREIGRIWDFLFEGPGDRPNARCIFEQLRNDPNGFFIGTTYNKNRPVYRIYADKWLNIGDKREWLLLIEPSEGLKKLLKMSIYSGHRPVKEIRFKDTYLYSLGI